MYVTIGYDIRLKPVQKMRPLPPDSLPRNDQVLFSFHVKNLVIMPNSHIAIRPGVKRSNGQFTVDCPSK